MENNERFGHNNYNNHVVQLKAFIIHEGRTVFLFSAKSTTRFREFPPETSSLVKSPQFDVFKFISTYLNEKKTLFLAGPLFESIYCKMQNVNRFLLYFEGNSLAFSHI